MSLRMKARALVGIATLVPMAAILVALSWHAGAAAPLAEGASHGAVNAHEPGKAPTALQPGNACRSTVDSCPYVYTFDQSTFYSTI